MPQNDEPAMLASIKATLGLDPAYDVYDVELLLHMNSVVATLHQLGVGPQAGMYVDATTVWSSLLEDQLHLNMAKSYMFLKLKMLFDASNMQQHLVSAYEKMILEAEERLKIAAEPYIPQAPPEDPILV